MVSPGKIRAIKILIAAAVIILAASAVFFTLCPAFQHESVDLENSNLSYKNFTGTLHILTTPDIHSHLFSMSENDTGSRIGRISALADKLGENNSDTLYLFAGDLGEGNFYHKYLGMPEENSYFMAGIDAAVPGNHAFDYSAEFFKTWAINSSYPLVCANIDFSDTELNETIKDYTIINTKDAKVGIFGIITPQLEKYVTDTNGIFLYQNTKNISESVVKKLQNEGCDAIIALTHQYGDEDEELAESVSGISLIVGGHDHLSWNKTVKSPDNNHTLIVHSGKYGEEISRISISFENGTLTNTNIERYEITEDLPDDSSVTSFVMPYYHDYIKSLSEPVGVTAVPLDATYESLRNGESNAGDFITDTITKNICGSEIAFINSGSIRGDYVIPAGEISYLTLTTLLPFENMIVNIEMSGSDIKNTLERSASALRGQNDDFESDERTPNGGFLQVSGVRFAINTDSNPFRSDPYTGSVLSYGDRIENLSVVTDEGIIPIDLKKTYTVSVNNYLAGGGDGYSNLAEISDDKKYCTEINLINLLTDEIGKNSPVAPGTDGRIVIL